MHVLRGILQKTECTAAYGVLVYRAGGKSNLLVMTGYCVQGTLGHAVVMGQRDAVPIGDGQTIDVKCAVRNISFRYVAMKNDFTVEGATLTRVSRAQTQIAGYC